MRALIAFRSGDLDDASADAGASLDGCVEYGLSFVLPGPLGVLVDVVREQADLAGAAVLLEAHPYSMGSANRSSIFSSWRLEDDYVVLKATSIRRSRTSNWAGGSVSSVAGGHPTR